MKLFQSKIAVGLLAAAAFVLIFVNLIWPLASPSLKRLFHRSVRLSLKTEAPAQLKAALTNSSIALPPGALSGAPMDLARASASAPLWIESPRRDPFEVRRPSTNQTAIPPARDLLRLKAVWRQTGSTLAVLNDRVVGEGDTLLHFKIETIEGDRVWVSGPNGREDVEFGPTTAARQPPAK